MPEKYIYPGQELELFKEAKNWKRYFGTKLSPYLTGKVLEVGAGMGETTIHLPHRNVTQWTCLEPDPALAAILQEKKDGSYLPEHCQVVNGSLANLDPSECFDTILYIDVLEHIEHDREEVERAGRHLSPGGHLVVLCPAYNFLYSEFDKAIGHYKRYTAADLRKLTPEGLDTHAFFYLDSMGFFASLMNRLLLHQSYPTKQQVAMWDRYFVPVSRVLDSLFFRTFGKAVIAIWKKQ